VFLSSRTRIDLLGVIIKLPKGSILPPVIKLGFSGNNIVVKLILFIKSFFVNLPEEPIRAQVNYIAMAA
jgi:hypothetical protein